MARDKSRMRCPHCDGGIITVADDPDGPHELWHEGKPRLACRIGWWRSLRVTGVDLIMVYKDHPANCPGPDRRMEDIPVMNTETGEMFIQWRLPDGTVVDTTPMPVWPADGQVHD